MAGLLAGLPDSSGGVTLNRLCGSGLDAVAMAARAIRGGESDLIIAGGSESMSRAPFVMAKATSAFDRNAEMYDTTIGWRFVNPKMKAAYGDDTMPNTGENVAQEFQISRPDQDSFALRRPRPRSLRPNSRCARQAPLSPLTLIPQPRSVAARCLLEDSGRRVGRTNPGVHWYRQDSAQLLCEPIALRSPTQLPAAPTAETKRW